jgi:hypothetical protein
LETKPTARDLAWEAAKVKKTETVIAEVVDTAPKDRVPMQTSGDLRRASEDLPARRGVTEDEAIDNYLAKYPAEMTISEPSIKDADRILAVGLIPTPEEVWLAPLEKQVARKGLVIFSPDASQLHIKNLDRRLYESAVVLSTYNKPYTAFLRTAFLAGFWSFLHFRSVELELLEDVRKDTLRRAVNSYDKEQFYTRRSLKLVHTDGGPEFFLLMEKEQRHFTEKVAVMLGLNTVQMVQAFMAMGFVLAEVLHGNKKKAFYDIGRELESHFKEFYEHAMTTIARLPLLTGAESTEVLRLVDIFEKKDQ